MQTTNAEQARTERMASFGLGEDAAQKRESEQETCQQPSSIAQG
jgi:hypothetical protein